VVDQLKQIAYARAGRKSAQVDPSGLVSEAILRAAGHWREVEDMSKVKAWVRTILVREVIARLRLDSVSRTQEFGSDELQTLRDFREQQTAVEREDEVAFAKARLWHLLSRLPDADREVISLCRLAELSDEEVATLLEISPEALRQRRSRAMRRLQDLARQQGLA
jgi:RNA polymerase sigma factor (sigma-70 family)